MQKNTDQRWQWEDVRLFLAVARAGSLSGAARSLGVEHSTLARRLASMELGLGLRLFDRLARGWSLTHEGHAMLPQAERLEEQAMAFERTATSLTQHRGTVSVTVPPSLGALVLAPAMAEREARWRNLDLLVLGDINDADLARREADIAIRLARPNDSALAVRHLCDIHIGLYGTVRFRQTDPAQWSFVAFNDSLAAVEHQQWLEAYRGERPVRFRSNDLTSVYQAIRGGLGVGCLPHYCVRPEDNLVLLAPERVIPPQPLWLVIHEDVRRSPKVRQVADLLSEIVLEERQWLETAAACHRVSG